MAQGRTPLEFPDTKTFATLTSEFTIMAECSCGHSRELHALSLRRGLGNGVTLGKVRAREAAVPQVPSPNAADPCLQERMSWFSTPLRATTKVNGES
jgi:hypothetical protein